MSNMNTVDQSVRAKEAIRNDDHHTAETKERMSLESMGEHR
ncbi:hypothetical protein DAI22_03g024950 [Oryza sativa Japonica Group]|nr:hypothetical protein DAI22_03g024950 [Oryza sativa Japonica Group]